MTMHHPKRPAVLGTGLISLDIVLSADASQPLRSWTGGTCGNVLIILSYLGWDAYPIGRLNGDSASLRVKADLQRWGVHLDYAECVPTCATPIIIQEIRRGKDGTPKHRFSWSCPRCGSWLPSFKPVTARSVESIVEHMTTPRVFFMDRLSRASLILATAAAERGAMVVFEPSAKSDEKLLEEALRLSHIVKYADQRVTGLDDVCRSGSSVRLEIQTLGSHGLRFRSRLPNTRTRKWEHLPAAMTPVLADTCGAGDWCTAGVLSRIATEGADGLKRLNGPALRDALRFGQALAAWNCGFEGARGGMYRVDRPVFEQEVKRILGGGADRASQAVVPSVESSSESVMCPACPPGRRRNYDKRMSVA
ncbi:MAG: PfkB family carbohydrate kinase [Rhodospirillales bacterium]|nr:PfkB family carbohydrate kinase [Rhodospirillales bacterium]